MPDPIPLESLRTSPQAWLFEGGEAIDASFFVTAIQPGRGVSLHVHPYAEVFLVEEGEATFTVGDAQQTVTAGHVFVVPPQTPHGFVSSGGGDLRTVSVHPSPEVRQTWLED